MGELHLSFIIFCLSTSLDIMLQVYKPNRLDKARNGRWQRLVGKRYTCRYKLQVWRWKTWKMGPIGAKHTPHSEISYKKYSTVSTLGWQGYSSQNPSEFKALYSTTINPIPSLSLLGEGREGVGDTRRE